MKNIYLTRNLLEVIAYDYDELKNPMKNLSDYDYFIFETKNNIYYQEDRYDCDNCYLLENVKSAYEQTEEVFDEINTLETANEIECYLYSSFGENAKTSKIFNYYMKGREHYAKLKTFWMILDNMN